MLASSFTPPRFLMFVAFWNPNGSYRFACQGGVLSMGGIAYAYSLQLDRSNANNLCLTWANFNMYAPVNGFARVDWFAHGTQPASFSVYLPQMV